MLREAEVKVNLNENEIRKYIQEKLDEQLHDTLFLVTADKIAERCSISKRFAEDAFLSDPRFRAIEKRRSRMRLYVWEEAKEVLLELLEEW